MSSPREAQTSAQVRPELPDLNATIDNLYRAFCFDAGGEADWAAIRSLSAPGASFFSPISEGGAPKGVASERFIAEFQDYIRASPMRATGYHERVLHARIDRFGTIAHAFVVFEGFVPGEEPDRRGVDSVQFVLAGDRWLVASFTTQYESEAAPIPMRYL